MSQPPETEGPAEPSDFCSLYSTAILLKLSVKVSIVCSWVVVRARFEFGLVRGNDHVVQGDLEILHGRPTPGLERNQGSLS